MSTNLLKKSINRIAIVRELSSLKDLLCIVPALRALRAAFPHAHITFIGNGLAGFFVQRWNHLVNDFIEFPGYPGITESSEVKQIPAFLAKIHSLSFDLALQMHDNGIVMNSFTSLLGARINAGFYAPGYFCPDPDYFIPYPDDEPEIWRYLHLIEFLGIPLQSDELEFPLREIDFIELNKIKVAAYLQPKKYICINLGAEIIDTWSRENFASIGSAIIARGYDVVLTGTVSETEMTKIISLMQTQPINVTGKISIGAMAALLTNARLTVSNDIDMYYLTTALNLPSIAIVSNAAKHRAPMNHQIHRVLTSEYKIPKSEWIGWFEHEVGATHSQMSAKLAVTPTMVITQIAELLH